MQFILDINDFPNKNQLNRAICVTSIHPWHISIHAVVLTQRNVKNGRILLSRTYNNKLKHISNFSGLQRIMKVKIFYVNVQITPVEEWGNAVSTLRNIKKFLLPIKIYIRNSIFHFCCRDQILSL